MKNNVVQLSIIVAVISLIIGVIGHFTHRTILFTNFAWHLFAQTCLLLAIAWGVWMYSIKEGNKK
jgi:hypothetical protein